jgi:protein PhnA
MHALVVCPECGHEWVPAEGGTDSGAPAERVGKDSVGNVLQEATPWSW